MKRLVVVVFGYAALKLETTVSISEDKKKAVLAALSKIVAETIGKPEQYVMVTAITSAILHVRHSDDAAFVDVRSIRRFDRRRKSKAFRENLQAADRFSRVPQKRIY